MTIKRPVPVITLAVINPKCIMKLGNTDTKAKNYAPTTVSFNAVDLR